MNYQQDASKSLESDIYISCTEPSWSLCITWVLPKHSARLCSLISCAATRSTQTAVAMQCVAQIFRGKKKERKKKLFFFFFFKLRVCLFLRTTKQIKRVAYSKILYLSIIFSLMVIMFWFFSFQLILVFYWSERAENICKKNLLTKTISQLSWRKLKVKTSTIK